MSGMTDRLEAEISQEVHAAIKTSMGDAHPADVETMVDAVMLVIAGRARAIHLCFPQESFGSGFTLGTSWPS